MTPYQFSTPPVAIGGVGGSGTRMVAEILGGLGFFLGDDLNGPRDNISFSFLLKRSELWPLEDHEEELDLALDIFFNAMYFHRPLNEQHRDFITMLGGKGRPPHAEHWPAERANYLLNQENSTQRHKYWGWKEPNTHIFLPLLIKRVPDFKYIHVVRNGLDMAFSDNHSQALLWGKALTGINPNPLSPQYLFDYWCLAHERVLYHAQELQNNFYMLNYDQFCRSPKVELLALVDFLGVEALSPILDVLIAPVVPPSSIGRYKQHEPLSVTSAQRDLLAQLGLAKR